MDPDLVEAMRSLDRCGAPGVASLPGVPGIAAGSSAVLRLSHASRTKY